MPQVPITLEDPSTGKTADLTDDQGVRLLLSEVVNRFFQDNVEEWREPAPLPEHPTERVAVELLRAHQGMTLTVIRTAESLSSLFLETSLGAELAGLPKSTKAAKLVGLTDESARDQLAGDVAEALERVWPAFRKAIEETQGARKQSLTVKVAFSPATEKSEAFVSVVGGTALTAVQIDRQSTVRKLKSGRYQLELFDN